MSDELLTDATPMASLRAVSFTELEAMRRAVTELVGTIDPTARGLSSQPRKKRSSSSNLPAIALPIPALTDMGVPLVSCPACQP